MGFMYKDNRAGRIVLITLMSIFFCIRTDAASAASGLFTVSDVKVDVTAADALSAREEAFAEARIKAFEKLAERMLTEEDMGSFDMPGPDVVSMLIKDYEVTNEKLSTVRYIGTYTFRFEEQGVRRFLGQRGHSFTNVGSRPLLILPFFEYQNRTVLWSPYNSWLEAWERKGDLDGLVPIVVPLGDLDDVRDLGGDDALTYDERGLSRMLARYGAGEAVLAVAIPNNQSNETSIYLYRTDRARPEFVTRIDLRGTGPSAFEQGVERVTHALQRDWKARTQVRSDDENRLQVRVEFSSLAEWAEIQRELNRVYGITSIDLKEISPRAARLDLLFQGTERRLRLALQQSDMTLTAPKINVASLGPQSDRRPGTPLVYQLYINNTAGRIPQSY